LQDCLEYFHKNSGIDFFLFDDRGKELTGRNAPEGVKQAAALAGEKSAFSSVIFQGRQFSAQRISGRNGNSYTIAGAAPGPPPAPFREAPPMLFIRLLVLIPLSGAGCYWLTLYVTAPIIRLSHAVRQFAAGDHSIRVGSELAARKDEISQLASDFDFMASRIESLISSQRNLLRDISHELRSPLARLRVALELCRQKGEAESKKYLNRIERESERLNQLIGETLTLNRYDSGVPLPVESLIDLERLIREIVEDADFEAQGFNRGVKLVSCDNCTVKGSEESLRRAVENVVRNAVRYTSEGSVVEVSLRQSGEGKECHALVTVRDHGPGAPEDTLSMLFKPFYRVDKDRDRLTGGAGLGLAITEAAVRLHRGGVSASNAPGGGLLVEITLPLS